MTEIGPHGRPASVLELKGGPQQKPAFISTTLNVSSWVGSRQGLGQAINGGYRRFVSQKPTFRKRPRSEHSILLWRGAQTFAIVGDSVA